MFKKSLLTAGIAMSLSATAVLASPLDGLTLINKNISPAIAVKCGPISGQNLNPGTPSKFPWDGIIVMFGSSTVDCDFFIGNDSGTKIGSAHIEINSRNQMNPLGTVTPTFIASNYAVTPDKKWGTPNANMTVTISKQ